MRLRQCRANSIETFFVSQRLDSAWIHALLAALRASMIAPTADAGFQMSLQNPINPYTKQHNLGI